MTIRKHISMLLAILLVVTMTSQAVAAYVMSCQGTASCCCIAPQPGMDMNGAMTGGMDRNCCTASAAEPCDIETTAHTGALPFLSGFVTGSADCHMAAGVMALVIDPGDVALDMARYSKDFTDRDGPPIYLQTQHFLC